MERPLPFSWLEGASNYISGPTTAVDLETVTSHDPIHSSQDAESIYNSVSDYQRGEEDQEEDLQHLFSNLIRPHPSKSYPGTIYEYDRVPENLDHVRLSKDDSFFNHKLKQVFIFSAAGKPIYSMNGSDQEVLGYMGLITTLTTSSDKIKSISYNDMKLVVLNKSPIILVAISKIAYEKFDIKYQDSILHNQLNTLYDYLISMISKSTIDKNFKNRMNYDLRKVLTPLDSHNLDSLCMKLTYGLDIDSESNILTDEEGFQMFICELLQSSLSCCKIRHSTRQNLNSILLDSRKHSEDLLFGFLLYKGRIMAAIKPKVHNLINKDIKILLSMIANQQQQSTTDDLWIPICMPHFNNHGFLYCFLKTINGVTIALLSSNKNSFFAIQTVAQVISEKFMKLSILHELTYTTISITNDIKVQLIDHFIYKSKHCQQFVASEITDVSIDCILQLACNYSFLYNSQATPLKSSISNSITAGDKKISFIRFTNDKSTKIGLTISNSSYEFYCLCSLPNTPAQNLVKAALKIIHWCGKYHKRLFIDSSATF